MNHIKSLVVIMQLPLLSEKNIHSFDSPSVHVHYHVVALAYAGSRSLSHILTGTVQKQLFSSDRSLDLVKVGLF